MRSKLYGSVSVMNGYTETFYLRFSLRLASKSGVFRQCRQFFKCPLRVLPVDNNEMHLTSVTSFFYFDCICEINHRIVSGGMDPITRSDLFFLLIYDLHELFWSNKLLNHTLFSLLKN